MSGPANGVFGAPSATEIDQAARTIFQRAFPRDDFHPIEARSAFHAIELSMMQQFPTWAIPTVDALMAVAHDMGITDWRQLHDPVQVCRIFQRYCDLNKMNLRLGIYIDGRPFIHPDPVRRLYEYRRDTVVWIQRRRDGEGVVHDGMAKHRRSPRLAKSPSIASHPPRGPKSPRSPPSGRGLTSTTRQQSPPRPNRSRPAGVTKPACISKPSSLSALFKRRQVNLF